MGLLSAKKGEWDKAIYYYSLADKFASETKRTTWQAFLYWSMISLYSIGDIPENVSQLLFNKSPEWYRKELEAMKLRIGWKNDF